VTDDSKEKARIPDRFGRDEPGFLWRRWWRRRRPEAQILASELDLIAAEKLGVPADIIAQIESRFRDHEPSEQIAAAVELRKQMLNCPSFDDARVKRLILHLRERYATALGAIAAEKYARTQIDLNAAETTSSDLKAEADSLLEQLKLIYTLSSERDSLLARMRRWALFLLAGLFVALGVISMAGDDIKDPVRLITFNDTLNMTVLAVVGAAGAMVSLLRRTEDVAKATAADVDPVRQISALQQGITAVFISGFVGAAVAYVLLALFAMGHEAYKDFIPPVLQPLFPTIKPCDPGRIYGCIALVDSRIQFDGFANMAKMLIWAFIGGFAEQLVPDILDRITRAAKVSQETVATASNPPAEGG